MALTLFWTKRAETRFDDIIAYLELNWRHTSAKNFVSRVYELLDILVEFPEMGAIQQGRKGIRGFVIIKQVILFYKLETNRIIILNLFDTRQSLRKKKL